MQGQYILDRWMVGIIKDICQDVGVVCTTYSEDWMLELSKENKKAKIFGYKFSLNDAASTAIAGDKVATYQLLTANDIPAVEHRLVRTKASQSTDWDKDLGKIVIKPLDGTSGHGIALLNESVDVEAYITQHPYIAAWAVSPYEEIISERRFILLDGKILCQYKKLGVMRGGLRMFNLGLGATAEHSEAGVEETHLALQALEISGLRLAAVDIIQTPGGYKVLEVNDGIMMENYMRQSDANKKQTVEVYRAIIEALFT
jgi:glutathione synthase/RimK-type ligase-like ATP-grasp enzyme